ncbi:unnamed protein product, partial [Rangifer tarandus platyrhynchus]
PSGEDSSLTPHPTSLFLRPALLLVAHITGVDPSCSPSLHRPARPGNGARGPAKDPARGEDAPLTFSEKFGSPDAPVARGARGRETTPARLRDALPHANLGDELSREERRLREAARAGASPPAFAPRDQTRGSRAARQPRSCCRQTKFKKNTPTVPSGLCGKAGRAGGRSPMALCPSTSVSFSGSSDACHPVPPASGFPQRRPGGTGGAAAARPPTPAAHRHHPRAPGSSQRLHD